MSNQTRSLIREANRLLKNKQYIEAGELFQMAGKYKKAVKVFLHENAFNKAGEVYFSTEQYKKAAEMFIQDKDYERAATAYHRIQDFTKAKEMRLLLADKYKSTGKPILAAETYESCGEYDRAADLFLSSGLPDRAVRMLERTGQSEKLSEIQNRLAGTIKSSEEPESLTYRDAGVDIDLYEKCMERVIPAIRSTFTGGVKSDIGTFGGIFSTGADPKGQRLLVSSVDSVGTKLKIAFMADIHCTIGIDIVSHCANDILVQGAEPLFFMDYIGTGKIEDYILEDIIKGLVDACKNIDCALLGGEIAELPGLYNKGEYDLVGFIVGAVMQKDLIDGSRIKPGDSCIGIASNGLHTNGYSLTRKIIFEKAKLGINDIIPGVNRSVSEELLTPHRCYVRPVMSLRKNVDIKGLAHITGGGITDNLPRILPAGMHSEIRVESWPKPLIFEYIKSIGNVREEEMLHTFNMGIGMIVVVSANDATQTIKLLESLGEQAYVIGNIKEKGEGVVYVQK